MSYQQYENDECDECMRYVAFFANADPWTCMVCGLTETVGEWGRYQLPCGHQAHIRCFRRWCKSMAQIGCAGCGIRIPPLPQNEYCDTCGVFGHPALLCEKIGTLTVPIEESRPMR